MRLVYLSPVPWDSFAQRPHKFVEWFNAWSGKDVMWVDPYPVRLPKLSDIRIGAKKPDFLPRGCPLWLTVVKPGGIPIEPLAGSGFLNRLFWRDAKSRVRAFADEGRCLLGIGKPSVLALELLNVKGFSSSFYDAMDDFPAFFSGLSQRALARREAQIAMRVNHVFASSSVLAARWKKINSDTRLVPNALDPAVMPFKRFRPLSFTSMVFGYVGTMGAWFDWESVVALALGQPKSTIFLIGPHYSVPPVALPSNIKILGPMQHQKAMIAISGFDVGLIPFKVSPLTDSVDPIKFYEYRALGVPVISTNFGEMRLRTEEPGTFIVEDWKHGGAIDLAVRAAVCYHPDDSEIAKFTCANNWSTRFNALSCLFE